jgi:hypothetical protein
MDIKQKEFLAKWNNAITKALSTPNKKSKVCSGCYFIHNQKGMFYIHDVDLPSGKYWIKENALLKNGKVDCFYCKEEYYRLADAVNSVLA